MITSSALTPDADHAAGLDALLREALQRVWGFSGFRPLQREAMHAILAARDSVVVLPTGGGKSLCFQAPAVVQAHGVGVVISPLISLMKDQVDGLRVDGVSAAYLNSTQTSDERDSVVASLRADRCRLLYVSPNASRRRGPALRLLQQAGVRFIAVDRRTASARGHDFVEARQIGRRDEFWACRCAFTATATDASRGHRQRAAVERSGRAHGSFDARSHLPGPAAGQSASSASRDSRAPRRRCRSSTAFAAEVGSVAERLVEDGHRAVPCHAGLPDHVRSDHQEAFFRSADIVVATVAFGMARSVNVRFVVRAGAHGQPSTISRSRECRP